MNEIVCLYFCDPSWSRAHALQAQRGGFMRWDTSEGVGERWQRQAAAGIYTYMVQPCNPPPPPPRWWWSGGSCVWRGCPTGVVAPAPPVGVGGAVCGGINFVLCMYVHTGNDVDLEDDVCGGVAPQGYVTPAPLVGGGRELQSYCVCFVLLLYRGFDRYNMYACMYVWVDGCMYLCITCIYAMYVYHHES